MPAGPDGRRKTSRLPPVLRLSVAKERMLDLIGRRPGQVCSIQPLTGLNKNNSLSVLRVSVVNKNPSLRPLRARVTKGSGREIMSLPAGPDGKFDRVNIGNVNI